MQKNKRGNLGFGIIFIILSLAVIVLAGAVAFRLITTGRTVVAAITQPDSPSPANAAGTPSPKPSSSPKPTLTPSPDEKDRVMPELDGVTPVLPLTGENTIPEIFESVNKAVVGIMNYQTQQFGTQELLEVYGTGTGVIVSTNGYILTNQHVLDNAEKIMVTLVTGEEYEARLIGGDVDTDIAVIKIDAEGLKAAPVGDSDKVRVGEYVLAIGNPIDSERLANTLTLGIISAKERSITIDGHTNSYLQTDAAVNYGNSGGPLINMSGEIIGINSAKTIVAGYDSLGLPVSAEGIGFSLPINEAVRIMKVLIENGSVERPAIGIMVTTLDAASAAQFDTVPGIYVDSVVTGGPADLAGLKAGDHIITVDGHSFAEHQELVQYIATKKVGDTLTFVVDRAGEQLTVTINLGNKATFDYDAVNPVGEEAEKQD